MKSQTSTYTDQIQELDFEKILNNPILDIGARFFEPERYEAFKICYSAMRVIDDLVDDIKVATEGNISKEVKVEIKNKITEWIEAIDNWTPQDSSQKRLIETITKFQIPLWPWDELSKSMIYDLDHDGFDSFEVFLKYCEGAAISPGAVFMHLCGVKKDNGHFVAPIYDIKKAARPLAIFCYLVHIFRDFQKDQGEHLNYFAFEMLTQNGLDISVLRDIAAGSDITSEFRNMMKAYYGFAKQYQQESRQMIDEISSNLEPRYRLSLEVIYSLYNQIFERIDIKNGSFSTQELNPSADEVKQRIETVVSSFSS